MLKSDAKTILKRHIVDVTRVCAEFREARAKEYSPSCQGYHINKDLPNRLVEQTRLSVYNWNTGPRRGKKLSKSTLLENGTIIMIQEANEYYEHDFLTNRLHVHTRRRVRGLVQQGYLLLGHQSLLNLSPRHQGLRSRR